MIAWDAVRLRDSLGRFASLKDDGFREEVAAEMEAVRGLVEDVFKSFAPYDAERDGPHFRDGLTAEVGEGGALLSVSTDNPQLRTWLKEGTKPHAINAKYNNNGYFGVLHWVSGGTDHFARYVFHPGTQPNDWEDRATAAVEDVVRVFGERVADHVTRRISL